AYAAAPVCAPTRACLMTGQYTPRHGVYTVVDARHAAGSPHHRILAAESAAELPPETHTIAEAMRDAGYATGMVGMWNLGRGRRGPNTPLGRGFGSFVQPRDLGFEKDAYVNADGDYLTDRMTDAGIHFIRQNAARPFFLYLAYHAIHPPFDAKLELLAKYQKQISGKTRDAAYAATVEALDQNMGRLMGALKTLGLTDDTYILFTSDNGSTRRHVAPLRGGKGSLYEGGLRVPAFLTGPGIAPGRSSAEPVSTIDIYPTVLEWAGATRPDDHVLDGKSLAPLATAESDSLGRRALYWHLPVYAGQSAPMSAMRAGSYKLIEHFETNRIELFDLTSNAGETRDLAKERPILAADLHNQLKAWQVSLNAPRPTGANPAYDPSARRKKGRDQRGKGGKNREPRQ
ncbi:MAG: sulfatase, partial [Rhodospirillales bacterium]|nr:sulfatase [Rhodospirillales bacterium]